MRSMFDKELDKLRVNLLEMCSMVDELFAGTTEALKIEDHESALRLARSDDVFDQMANDIEQMCINLIARQQPLARDLRTITATLKIITDIERIADQCADVCEIISGMSSVEKKENITHLAGMMNICREMFAGFIAAYKKEDTAAAREVCKRDDEIDSMFSDIVVRISKEMPDVPDSVMSSVNLMFIAKYIERMADHCTNISEWVIFISEGVHPDLNPHFIKQDK